MGGGRARRVAVVAASLAACHGPAPDARADGSVATAAPGPVAETAAASTSVEGRALELVVLGDGPRTVSFLASIHGDEPSGTPLCEWLVATLEHRPELLVGVRAVVVARVNPDGLARGSRGNARGVDLNRNFPSSNFVVRDRNGPAPLSEPESRFVDELLRRYPPQLVLSFHQAAECIDYDGPAQGWARALAAASPLGVRRMGTRPGSLGSYAGVDLGIPTLTVELSRADLGRTPEELADRYGALLLRALGPEPEARPQGWGRLRPSRAAGGR